MMRQRNLPTEPEQESKALVADFFEIDVNLLVTQPQPNTFSIDMSHNSNLQKKFKTIAPYGNTKQPGVFDFSQPVLVMWTGSKVQPA